VIFATFLCTCIAEKPSSGAEIGYALESSGEFTYPEFVQTVESCMSDEDCHVVDDALHAYPIPDDEYVESKFPAQVEEAAMPTENRARGRLLAGLPDRYKWGNAGTRHCANEGEWCACHGNVVYTKKCLSRWGGCNQANWAQVVARGFNSNHRSKVTGGIWCDNGIGGGDPFRGHDKQCFCHPHTVRDTTKGTCSALEYVNMGMENRIGGRTVETDWVLCRDRCASTDGCLYFTWWWDGGCHLGGEGTSLAHFGTPTTSGNCGIWSQPKTRFQYVQKWTEEKCHQTCGKPDSQPWSDDWWKGAFCGFSCTGGCTAQAMAFISGREHKFPIEACTEFCYCVAKGWTG